MGNKPPNAGIATSNTILSVATARFANDLEAHMANGKVEPVVHDILEAIERV